MNQIIKKNAEKRRWHDFPHLFKAKTWRGHWGVLRRGVGTNITLRLHHINGIALCFYVLPSSETCLCEWTCLSRNRTTGTFSQSLIVNLRFIIILVTLQVLQINFPWRVSQITIKHSFSPVRLWRLSRACDTRCGNPCSIPPNAIQKHDVTNAVMLTFQYSLLVRPMSCMFLLVQKIWPEMDVGGLRLGTTLPVPKHLNHFYSKA